MIVTLAQLEEASVMQARAIKFYRKPKNRARMAFSISMEERYVGQSRSPNTGAFVGVSSSD